MSTRDRRSRPWSGVETGAGLLRHFDLEPAGGDAFVAPGPSIGQGRIFGGQVAGQSLRAACLTVAPGRAPHSLHAYFLRQGRPDRPLRFDVGRTRDGRSFATRHVTASQGDTPIFEMLASFHVPEAGHEWQPPPPADVPGPDGLVPPDPESYAKHVSAFEIRPVPPRVPTTPPPRHPFWIRLREPIGDDPVLHACVITYISDIGVVTSTRADARIRLAMGVSLDHTVWFHRPARADEWLLCSVAPATNAGCRGLGIGTIHTAGGALVSSLAQEALLRPHESRPGR